MPVRWDAEQDRILLFLIVQRARLGQDVRADIARSWPNNRGEKPTARAIKEHLSKISKEARKLGINPITPATRITPRALKNGITQTVTPNLSTPSGLLARKPASRKKRKAPDSSGDSDEAANIPIPAKELKDLQADTPTPARFRTSMTFATRTPACGAFIDLSGASKAKGSPPLETDNSSPLGPQCSRRTSNRAIFGSSTGNMASISPYLHDQATESPNIVNRRSQASIPGVHSHISNLHDISTSGAQTRHITSPYTPRTASDLTSHVPGYEFAQSLTPRYPKRTSSTRLREGIQMMQGVFDNSAGAEMYSATAGLGTRGEHLNGVRSSPLVGSSKNGETGSQEYGVKKTSRDDRDVEMKHKEISNSDSEDSEYEDALEV